MIVPGSSYGLHQVDVGRTLCCPVGYPYLQ